MFITTCDVIPGKQVEVLGLVRGNAEQRMVAEAQAMGANAIICARYASASVMEGTQEMLAYGTAVRYL